MASAHWRTGHTLASLLQSPQTGWEFLQLVRVLLSIQTTATVDATTAGETAETGDRPNSKQAAGSVRSNQPQDDQCSDNDLLDTLARQVKFHASLAADFAPGEIRKIEFQGNSKPTEVTVVNGVLSSANGPLPQPFIEWILDRLKKGDHAMAEFFDLFSNRLLAIKYLIGRSTLPMLLDQSAVKSYNGQLLLALVGQAMKNSPEERDIALAGLLANRRLSLPVVRELLKFSLGLTLVKMHSLVGGWLTVDKVDHSRLGDENVCRLGKNATLGRRVWDQQKTVELVLGPLSWLQLVDLVPGGQRYDALVAVLARISDRRCDFRITLLLPLERVSPARLGRHSGGLGLTSILSTTNFSEANAAPLRISFTVQLS